MRRSGWPRVHGLFLKIFVLLLVMLVVSYGLFGFITGLFYKGDLMKRQRMDDRMQLDRIGHFLTEAKQNGWNDEMVMAGLELTVPRHVRALYIIHQATGNVRYKLEDEEGPYRLDKARIQEVLAGIEDGRFFSEETSIQGKTVLVGQMLRVAGEGEFILLTASNLFARDVRIWNELLWIGIGIVVSCGAFFAFLLSNHLSRRVKKLEAASRSIATGQFQIEIPVHSRDELGRLARALEQMAHDLGSLDRMRKEFVANVSHDMRSPLTSMNGYLEAVLDGMIPPERMAKYIRIVQEQNKRLIRLVNDLLDIAKIEAGQFQIVPITFNVTEKVRQVLARMDPQLCKHEVVFDQVDADHDLWVHADPDRIEQVVVNLVQNAIEYSRPGSRITVKISKANAKHVAVAISDQGIGMESEDIARIWERFYKTDKARTRKNGTGIGLSIVKAILDQHQALIEVYSVPQQGTTFLFTLPLTEELTEAITNN
ncbi:sensor histidine kinase [Paenibacillus popilliae]|uniref:histidine kinase n=1 Tax=Paenibacillus popilliae ATCC 14706 TaxID=1212764 RepID=M9M4X0_PAEPP|nr:HAMP domain-containing sensor histidine kinase [Paenibacillus popilliae]GAC44144.1 signal transduction histidine kinase [Paenibacillus popilliae ATCC 14706]